MCGIFAIINKGTNHSSAPLVKGNETVRHRGPDDEGYLLWKKGDIPKVFAGSHTAADTLQHKNLEKIPDNAGWTVGLAHKRLAILDLSPGGHQPMVDSGTGISISFNGEIFNFREIRTELEKSGYKFLSESDTEVLLKAWVHWGETCLNRLNGMFSFIILDPRNGGKVYAVRDRFGVKPLYLAEIGDYIAFASEIKQIRTLPQYRLSLNEKTAYHFLASGTVDNSSETFDKNIHSVAGGSYVTVDIPTMKINLKCWYELKPAKWTGTEEEAIEAFRNLLTDSIRLRLRADVPVGSCLSGGLDSSAIVCLASDLLNRQAKHAGQVTVTACFENLKYDEWNFASEVVKKAGTRPVKVFPSFERLHNEIDQLIWHQDEPFGSTSIFSQWCVFSEAAKSGLKVMIDGQGSDEQLAGYGGNDIALYSGLLRSLSLLTLISEIQSYKKSKGHYPYAFILGAIQNSMPPFARNLLPRKYLITTPSHPSWLKLKAEDNTGEAPKSLNQSLRQQVLKTPLPALLRYEDRNSMTWSIESRVPFLDYRLVEFNLGLPEHLVFRKGSRKYVLRKSLKNIIPDPVLNRTDKMGFVTPEEIWFKETGKDWFRQEIHQAMQIAPEYFQTTETLKMVEDIASGKIPFNFTPWRIICFGRWLKMMQ